MTSQQLQTSTTLNPSLRLGRIEIVKSQRLQVVALFIILSSAVAIRTIHLNAMGYNSDEAVYAGQGAAIAQVPILTDIFPIFRAHPLLFQFTLALFFTFGANDLLGRLVSVAVGVATVLLVYRLGNRLYGQRAGFFAALFMALMPYHVVVTRQVLLDGPMAFCATLALYMLARFGETERPVWLVAAGAGMGLTFLAKETGILMFGSIYAFLALSPEIRTRIRDIILSTVVMVAIMTPVPLSTRLAGGGGDRTTGNYLVWQLFRRPNHTWDFYPTEVPPAIGILVIVAALLGFWLFRGQHGWREKMLVSWIIVPVVFFQLWPTKGFQYLLPIAPAVALLAARTLAHWPDRSVQFRNWCIPQYAPGLLFASIIAVSLFFTSWQRITPAQSDTFLAGSGGIPGGREMGHWIKANVPEDSTFLTIGPSMANIVKFYGHEQAFGLSVSPNPLHRNPSYEPIINPDFKIRAGELQYLVW
ncbi:MAG TPA: glycosyltransferase family 39 protein, partial [Anaerolineae bacterium]|nr:glycosyltransferase family 39 protein [Anaerolineae bacterium]